MPIFSHDTSMTIQTVNYLMLSMSSTVWWKLKVKYKVDEKDK